jgi:hypothetical protein
MGQLAPRYKAKALRPRQPCRNCGSRDLFVVEFIVVAVLSSSYPSRRSAATSAADKIPLRIVSSRDPLYVQAETRKKTAKFAEMIAQAATNTWAWYPHNRKSFAKEVYKALNAGAFTLGYLQKVAEQSSLDKPEIFVSNLGFHMSNPESSIWARRARDRAAAKNEPKQ